MGLGPGRAERRMWTWMVGGWSMGGETKSVLGPGIATATVTVTATGAAPVVVPDALVYWDPRGPRRTADGPRGGIAGAVTKAGRPR